MQKLTDKATSYLEKLCLEIPSRCVGSPGNQAATDFFAGIVSNLGFATELSAFDCLDWSQNGAVLTVSEWSCAAQVSPYSVGCQVRAPLVVVGSVADLRRLPGTDSVLLVHGDLAREQLMPKNFPFYNPEEHQDIIRRLELIRPRAIITATSRNPQMAGAVYPFPLIEDGDFEIPSVYLTAEEGQRLAHYAGQEIALEIRAERRPATGCNVVASKGRRLEPRLVLFAHIDAKQGTPGATDNATGVVVLMLLAELLQDYAGAIGVELVALNGEDYYSAPGEQLYLRQNADKFDQIALGINLDGAGFHQGKSAFSFYGCSPDQAESIRRIFAAHPEMIEGEPWYQGDHGLFLLNQRPALAITSEHALWLLQEITHTSADHPKIVAPDKLVAIAQALKDLVLGWTC